MYNTKTLVGAMLAVILVLTVSAAARADSRPNIVLIMADDLGYSDIGAYGSEIRTPNIDSLAQQGLQLTSFHSSPTCGPTRAMLMTGVDNHQAGLGTNAASLMRLPELHGRAGYEGYLNDEVVTFATLLNDTGYHTYMTGKWDLGIHDGKLPVDRGFDRYYGLGDGGASHFSDKIGTFAPKADAAYFDDDQRLSELPEDFYSSRTYTDKIIDFITANEGDDKPFMAYLAFTAPHWPLQVPDDWLDRYDGEYDVGWQSVRESRFRRQQDMGVLPAGAELSPQNRAVPNWDQIPGPRRDLETRRMELYAAMVENMDHNVGRLLRKLESLPKDRETVVIFLSDNGSEGNAIGDIIGNDYWVPNTFDNRLGNLGRVGSYMWLGAGWAHAGSTPFRIYKSFLSEGGIRTAAIFHSTAGRFDAGMKDQVVTIRDIAPTILEIAGVPHPGDSYKGRELVEVSGVSALDYLEGSTHTVHGDSPLGWELYGSRALIKGDWKAILIWPPEGDGQWALFNLATDPSESNNLANQSPELLQEMVEDWNDYAEDKGVFVFDRDLGYGRYR